MSEKNRDDQLEHDRKDGLAKRNGRDGVEPRNQPAEFVDDLRTNRNTEAPPPAEEESE